MPKELFKPFLKQAQTARKRATVLVVLGTILIRLGVPKIVKMAR